MHSSTMRYAFKPGRGERGRAIWRDLVFREADGAPGLILMQLFASGDTALAVGAWRDKSDAEAFMRTGVFKRLLEALRDELAEEPRPMPWSLEAALAGRG